MKRILAMAVLLALSGCARRVQVALPAAPAVALESQTVAVVAGGRACRDVADALVQRINTLEGMRVDPSSPVRLTVQGCSNTFDPQVDITVSDNSDWLGRITVVGRGHAVVQVQTQGETRATLIATGERYAQGELEGSMVALRKRVSRNLTEAVADDLTEQLRPIPRVVQRRVYPNAESGTARAHINLAVTAELEGDLLTARDHALRALEISPSAEFAAYARELDQLVQRMDVPSPTP